MGINKSVLIKPFGLKNTFILCNICILQVCFVFNLFQPFAIYFLSQILMTQ